MSGCNQDVKQTKEKQYKKINQQALKTHPSREHETRQREKQRDINHIYNFKSLEASPFDTWEAKGKSRHDDNFKECAFVSTTKEGLK